MLRDAWYGLRSLRRRPLSTAAAIATLAIGIGLNAAVFSVVDWVLLRPLPYRSPQELVKVFSAGVAPVTEPTRLTYSEFRTFSQATTVKASTAFSTATRIIGGQALDPAHFVLARVAGDLFGTLGVYPDIGRGFDHAEADSGAAVIVLSQGFWRTHLSADPGIVGRVVTIDGQSHSVAGVMPSGRGYPNEADGWRPLTASEREDNDRENVMIARLTNGVSAERAGLEFATLAKADSKGARTAWVEDLQRTDVRGVRAALTALLASAALVLLMACANVAALVAARSADRAGEMVVRGALGASRARLLQQLFIENVLLAAAGGAAGLLLGRWALDLLVTIAPGQLPRLAEISLDNRVILAGIGATMVVGLLVGLAPAFQASHFGARTGLGVTGSGRASGRSKGRRMLVAAQTAMAVVLAIGAGLLGRNLQRLVTIDHGFAPDRLLAVDLYLRGRVTGDARQLFRELIENVHAVRGVRSAAIALRLPTQIAGLRVPVHVEGRAADAKTHVTLRPVTPGYFETAGIPLTQGRNFTAADRQTAPGVAIVNAAFVREVLSRTRTVGTRLTTNIAEGNLSIVGVVADVTPAGESDRPAMYVPMDQIAFGGGYLIVRTEDDPQSVVSAVTTRIRAVAPALALDRIQRVGDALEAGRAVTRFNTQLAFAFAGLALLLAAIGVYGLTAGEIAARWRELAIRLALGATRGEALWAAMRPATSALAAGIVVGLAAALGVGRWLTSLLHGVQPADLLTLLAAPALLTTVGLLSAFFAAARVLRADPATTLRSE